MEKCVHTASHSLSETPAPVCLNILYCISFLIWRIAHCSNFYSSQTNTNIWIGFKRCDIITEKKSFRVRWYRWCLCYGPQMLCTVLQLNAYSCGNHSWTGPASHSALRSFLINEKGWTAAVWWISCVYWETFQKQKRKQQIPDLEPPGLNS